MHLSSRYINWPVSCELLIGNIYSLDKTDSTSSTETLCSCRCITSSEREIEREGQAKTKKVGCCSENEQSEDGQCRFSLFGQVFLVFRKDFWEPFNLYLYTQHVTVLL